MSRRGGVTSAVVVVLAALPLYLESFWLQTGAVRDGGDRRRDRADAAGRHRRAALARRTRSSSPSAPTATPTWPSEGVPPLAGAGRRRRCWPGSRARCSARSPAACAASTSASPRSASSSSASTSSRTRPGSPAATRASRSSRSACSASASRPPTPSCPSSACPTGRSSGSGTSALVLVARRDLVRPQPRPQPARAARSRRVRDSEVAAAIDGRRRRPLQGGRVHRVVDVRRASAAC